MIDQLYQNVVLSNNREPYHYGQPERFCGHGRGHNPTCGDDLTVYLGCDERREMQLHFTGEACAIATASASLMTRTLEGKSRVQLEALCKQFIQALEQGTHLDNAPDLASVAVLLNVRHFPGRLKCATLPWKALLKSLEFMDKSCNSKAFCHAESGA